MHMHTFFLLLLLLLLLLKMHNYCILLTFLASSKGLNRSMHQIKYASDYYID